MKVLLILAVLFVFAMAVVVAGPDGRFNGGSQDGYEVCSTNNSAIPPPPETGMVIIIQ